MLYLSGIGTKPSSPTKRLSMSTTQLSPNRARSKDHMTAAGSHHDIRGASANQDKAFKAPSKPPARRQVAASTSNLLLTDASMRPNVFQA